MIKFGCFARTANFGCSDETLACDWFPSFYKLFESVEASQKTLCAALAYYCAAKTASPPKSTFTALTQQTIPTVMHYIESLIL